MVTEAGNRETRIFTEDGIYEVTMLAKTPRAMEMIFQLLPFWKPLLRLPYFILVRNKYPLQSKKLMFSVEVKPTSTELLFSTLKLN